MVDSMHVGAIYDVIFQQGNTRHLWLFKLKKGTIYIIHYGKCQKNPYKDKGMIMIWVVFMEKDQVEGS